MPDVNFYGYHRFSGNGVEYGSYYIFQVTIADLDRAGADCETYDSQITEAGWYWQAQFPGCLPDGDPSGPYHTSRLAYEAANDFEVAD